MKLRRNVKIVTIVGILVCLSFFEFGCQTPKYSIPFITVREADFRYGPIDLPLNEKDKEMILSFLQRGGNWGNQDLVDFEAPTHYSGLLDLLSDPDFLYSRNFRNMAQIDKISPTMQPWFHNPIIYQIVDASQTRPPVHNPMSISDGKYWWIFYTQKETQDSNDSKVIRLTITASLSKSMKHFENIQEKAAESPGRNLEKSASTAIYSTKIDAPVEHSDFHTAFLEHLLQVSHVQLVSRLKDERLGFAFAHDVRIFIPDIHLLSKDRIAAFKYGTNYIPLLGSLIQELIKFKKSVSERGAQVTVYQLGDFFDVWRETPIYLSKQKFAEGTATFIQKIAEDHQVLYEGLFGPELNTHFVLGNHDFDVHYLEDFIWAEMRYYFPFSSEVDPIAVALHGDIFDKRERSVSEAIKHAAVYFLGPSVNQRVIDLTPVRDFIIEEHEDEDYTDYIQHANPPALGESLVLKDENLLVHEVLGDNNFNVFSPGHAKLPKKDLVFFPQAKEFAAAINAKTGWDLHIVVCGHTHHARIVIDETSPDQGGFKGGFFALVDCGAWIEEGKLNEEILPNAQIAILYNNEIRIYQLSPLDKE